MTKPMALLVHPGEILSDELKVRKLSASKLALDIGVPSGRIVEIINAKRSVTADTALRLSRYFGTSAQLWMNLQTQYDLATVEKEKGKQIAARIKPAA